MDPSRPTSPPAAPAPAFQPRRLSARDLEVRVNAPMRDMPTAMRQEIVKREQMLAARFEWLSPRRVRRLKHYLAGSVVVLPVLNAFLTPIGFHALWIQIPLAAVFGVVMALFQPRGPAVGFLLMGTAVATLALAGYGSWLSFSYGVIFVLSGYFSLGLALGVSENLARDEAA